MRKGMIVTTAVLFSIVGIAMSWASDMVSEQRALSILQPVVHDLTVAIVNGRPITSAELDAHIAVSLLPREEALEDLIDLHLLRAAATVNKIHFPAGTWRPEIRADIEFVLAQTLGVDIPPLRTTLVLDHAWLKDADDVKQRAAGRTLLERLRTLVEAGATIPDAFTRLQADGALWHIGDHEEYQSIILPTEAQNLPPGVLSPIIPGDGGLHLFKIYQRKQERPFIDDVRVPLLSRLRLDASIELPEAPTR